MQMLRSNTQQHGAPEEPDTHKHSREHDSEI